MCHCFIVLVENKGLLYISMDKNDIPNQVWYRQFSSYGSTIDHDKLLLQTDSSEKSMLKVSLSRDKQYVVITTSTRLSSEVSVNIMNSRYLSLWLNRFAYNIINVRYHALISNCVFFVQCFIAFV